MFGLKSPIGISLFLLSDKKGRICTLTLNEVTCTYVCTCNEACTLCARGEECDINQTGNMCEKCQSTWLSIAKVPPFILQIVNGIKRKWQLKIFCLYLISSLRVF